MVRRKRRFAKKFFLAACLFTAAGVLLGARLGRVLSYATPFVKQVASRIGLGPASTPASAGGPSEASVKTNLPDEPRSTVDPIIFEAQTEPPLDEPGVAESTSTQGLSRVEPSGTSWDDPSLIGAAAATATELSSRTQSSGGEVAQAALSDFDSTGGQVVPVNGRQWGDRGNDDSSTFHPDSGNQSSSSLGGLTQGDASIPSRRHLSPDASPISTGADGSAGRGASSQSSSHPGVQASIHPAPDQLLDLSEIDRLIQDGQDIAALRELSRIYWRRPEQRGTIRARLETLAKRVFFSPQPHYLPPYVVQPGDQLARIARRYKVSWQYLAKLNHVNPRRIRPGQKLKVIRGPFSALIDLSDFELTVHLNGYYVRSYQVGIGKDGSTPTGRFQVLNKVVNPQYTDPEGRVIDADDPNNPLGEYWLDLGDGYGIHGTIEPDSIGRAVSRGCIRMRNEDVAEVFDLLVVGSEVVIQP